MSTRYTECLAETGVVLSVSSVNDSYDNSLAETINGKTEVIRRRRSLAAHRRNRVCEVGVGGLVQAPSAIGADRRCATGKVRTGVLSSTGRVSYGGLAQPNESPEYPVRFSQNFM